ncbi:MAG TPA: hypothetical protein VEC01_14550, partial [Noviherbaspirillum sp.]|uniref:hypothetical protein n=1 Tax=Noviherbaspirillum sp. TaxID=1926288 RepID=UPI002D3C6252
MTTSLQHREYKQGGKMVLHQGNKAHDFVVLFTNIGFGLRQVNLFHIVQPTPPEATGYKRVSEQGCLKPGFENLWGIFRCGASNHDLCACVSCTQAS